MPSPHATLAPSLSKPDTHSHPIYPITDQTSPYHLPILNPTKDSPNPPYILSLYKTNYSLLVSSIPSGGRPHHPARTEPLGGGVYTSCLCIGRNLARERSIYSQLFPPLRDVNVNMQPYPGSPLRPSGGVHMCATAIAYLLVMNYSQSTPEYQLRRGKSLSISNSTFS